MQTVTVQPTAHQRTAEDIGLSDTWMRKNHRGGIWQNDGRLRLFRVSGFHVSYFKDEAATQLSGKLDMRNVRCFRTCTDSSAPSGAVELIVSERKGKDKTVIFAIPLEEAPRNAWLRYLASATACECITQEMRPHRDHFLAAKVDMTHGEQAVGSSSMFASKTPRNPRKDSLGETTANFAKLLAPAEPADDKNSPEVSPVQTRVSSSSVLSSGTAYFSGASGASTSSIDTRTSAASSCSFAGDVGASDRTSSRNSALLSRISAHNSGRMRQGSDARKKSAGGAGLNDEPVRKIAFPGMSPLETVKSCGSLRRSDDEEASLPDTPMRKAAVPIIMSPTEEATEVRKSNAGEMFAL